MPYYFIMFLVANTASLHNYRQWLPFLRDSVIWNKKVLGLGAFINLLLLSWQPHWDTFHWYCSITYNVSQSKSHIGVVVECIASYLEHIQSLESTKCG